MPEEKSVVKEFFADLSVAGDYHAGVQTILVREGIVVPTK
jgi:hypothetical protein